MRKILLKLNVQLESQAISRLDIYLVIPLLSSICYYNIVDQKSSSTFFYQLSIIPNFLLFSYYSLFLLFIKFYGTLSLQSTVFIFWTRQSTPIYLFIIDHLFIYKFYDFFCTRHSLSKGYAIATDSKQLQVFYFCFKF